MPGLGLPLYRALLKECRRLGQTLETLQIRQMVQGEWGRHSMGRIGVPQEELSVDLGEAQGSIQTPPLHQDSYEGRSVAHVWQHAACRCVPLGPGAP
jgi:hypothetical protein